MTTGLEWTSATELAKLIRRGKLSPVELVDALLDRIERVNPTVNAYCTVTADEARAAAREAEAAARSGDDLGLLHGVPYSLKDLTPNARHPHHDGLQDLRAQRARLRRPAGRSGCARLARILLGKTNTPEFGCKPFTDNRVFGATRNPWALDRSPGGSSGGAAAAVAAGLGPLAQGSDLAASIRQPAAWSGVVGFKPSQGRVPRVPNASGWSGLSVDGPITRTVADAALMFAAIAGPDPRDPLSLPSTGEEWEAIVDEVDPSSPSVRPARSARRLDARPRRRRPGRSDRSPRSAPMPRESSRRSTARLEEASPEIGEIEQSFVLLNAGLRQTALGKYLAEWRDQMDPILVSRLEVAGDATAVDVARAEVERTAYHQRLCAFFEQYDLLLLPTTATPPLPLDVQFPIEVGGRTAPEAVRHAAPDLRLQLQQLPGDLGAGRLDRGRPAGRAPDRGRLAEGRPGAAGGGGLRAGAPLGGPPPAAGLTRLQATFPEPTSRRHACWERGRDVSDASVRGFPCRFKNPSARTRSSTASNTSRLCSCSTSRRRKELRHEKLNPRYSSGRCSAYFQSNRTITCRAASRSGRFSRHWKIVTSVSSDGDTAARPVDSYSAANCASSTRSANYSPITRYGSSAANTRAPTAAMSAGSSRRSRSRSVIAALPRPRLRAVDPASYLTPPRSTKSTATGRPRSHSSTSGASWSGACPGMGRTRGARGFEGEAKPKPG